ncbi:hypothetical protein FOZ63_029152 [Perkinsus olseni]|uniref:HAT C-terminal dimerisation domain-containing protein n=1 Tax=Perkinsus olseni TaxID=32597 RepID=A0A7J6P0Y7_PEROL|nr:hypothetical protein FOZ60_001095 [Perkinsus olseni]KAF4723012.1 hypothetical protein FOZ62_031922 [Perkinsus olseni]KAF4728219.1 hypothetical protein FOZ63_029152 [Perkinsus olseni]
MIVCSIFRIGSMISSPPSPQRGLEIRHIALPVPPATAAIRDSINQLGEFSVLSDETSCHNESVLSIYCRHVSDAGGAISVEETLLHIQIVENTKSLTICDALDSSLKNRGLSTDNVHSVSFDGASCMASSKDGVYGRILEVWGRNIKYVHCRSHRLQLVARSVSKGGHPLIENCVDNIQGLYGLFSKSNKKVSILKSASDSLRESGDRYKGILEVAPTRWLSTAQAVSRLTTDLVTELESLDSDKLEAIIKDDFDSISGKLDGVLQSTFARFASLALDLTVEIRARFRDDCLFLSTLARSDSDGWNETIAVMTVTKLDGPGSEWASHLRSEVLFVKRYLAEEPIPAECNFHARFLERPKLVSLFPNHAHICSIVLCLPSSTASVERCFSTATRVASDHRHMSGETLGKLIRVKKIEAVGSQSGTTSKKVVIADSGELPLEKEEGASTEKEQEL